MATKKKTAKKKKAPSPIERLALVFGELANQQRDATVVLANDIRAFRNEHGYARMLGDSKIALAKIVDEQLHKAIETVKSFSSARFDTMAQRVDLVVNADAEKHREIARAHNRLDAHSNWIKTIEDSQPTPKTVYDLAKSFDATTTVLQTLGSAVEQKIEALEAKIATLQRLAQVCAHGNPLEEECPSCPEHVDADAVASIPPPAQPIADSIKGFVLEIRSIGMVDPPSSEEAPATVAPIGD